MLNTNPSDYYPPAADQSDLSSISSWQTEPGSTRGHSYAHQHALHSVLGLSDDAATPNSHKHWANLAPPQTAEGPPCTPVPAPSDPAAERLPATSCTKRRMALALPAIPEPSDFSPLSGSTSSTASRSPHSAISPTSSTHSRWPSPHGLISPCHGTWSRVHGGVGAHAAVQGYRPQAPPTGGVGCLDTPILSAESASPHGYGPRPPSFLPSAGPGPSTVSPGPPQGPVPPSPNVTRTPFGMAVQRPPPIAVQQMLQLQQQIQQQQQQQLLQLHRQQQLQQHQHQLHQLHQQPQWAELPRAPHPADEEQVQRHQLHQLQLQALGRPAIGLLAQARANEASVPGLPTVPSYTLNDALPAAPPKPLHHRSLLSECDHLINQMPSLSAPPSGQPANAYGASSSALLEFLQGCPAVGTSVQCDRDPRLCGVLSGGGPGALASDSYAVAAPPLFDGLQASSPSGLTPLFGPSFCPLRSPPAIHTRRQLDTALGAAPSVPGPAHVFPGPAPPAAAIAVHAPSVFSFPLPSQLALNPSSPAGHAGPMTLRGPTAPLNRPDSGLTMQPAKRVPALPTPPHKRKRSASAEEPLKADKEKSDRIGAYTREERKARIELYRAKRSKRNFSKRVTYMSRKDFADRRPRTGGRFSKLPRPSPIVCSESSRLDTSAADSESNAPSLSAQPPPLADSPSVPTLSDYTPTDDLDSLFAFGSTSPSLLEAPSRPSSLPSAPAPVMPLSGLAADPAADSAVEGPALPQPLEPDRETQ